MDDAVVWLDYHRDEVAKRDKRIKELESDLQFLTDAHAKLVKEHEDLIREHDEMIMNRQPSEDDRQRSCGLID